MIDQTIAELRTARYRSHHHVRHHRRYRVSPLPPPHRPSRLNRSTAGGDFTIRRMAITPIGSYRTYTVRLTGSDVLPNFGNYRWSEALGDIPTRVVFNLSHVTGIE